MRNTKHSCKDCLWYVKGDRASRDVCCHPEVPWGQRCRAERSTRVGCGCHALNFTPLTGGPYVASNYVLGRKPVRDRLRDKGVAVVSVYTHKGTMRYTGPVTQPAEDSKPSVRYRIRIKLKGAPAE